MTSRKARLVVGLLAFVLLYLLAIAVAIPKIENNLTADVEGQLAAGGIQGVGVTFSGRDGTLAGPLPLREPALAAVTDLWGIRSLTYRSTGAEVVVPSTVAETTTTSVEVTTTEATTTTAPATTTTEATTTTVATTTAPPLQYVDATVTIADQTVTLAGTVASSAQAQALADAATVAFGLQGTIVNQLVVTPQTAPAEIDRAVDGLAAFINAAGPALRNGSGHLRNQALTVQGDAFSTAAATMFNSALVSSAPSME